MYLEMKMLFEETSELEREVIQMCVEDCELHGLKVYPLVAVLEGRSIHILSRTLEGVEPYLENFYECVVAYIECKGLEGKKLTRLLITMGQDDIEEFQFLYAFKDIEEEYNEPKFVFDMLTFVEN